ncbi:MAG TPA: ArsA family ATPase [Symbiobacteriaceae bacterium]|jgi:arsenite-transporting ATPase
MMRVIVYTGKGGVGKTSVAAATAARMAARGCRTLVLSTDAAHSLADSLDRPLGPDPVEVAENLWGQEVDSLREAERSWGDMQAWLNNMLQWAKISDISSEELLVFPGLEELFSLLQIRDQVRSGRFDAIVVDCAPTGETLRLLSYPNSLRWWLDKMFGYKKTLLKVARPVVKMTMGGLELPSDQAINSVERLFRELGEMNELLLDPAITSVRLVLNPEKMVIAESRRSFTYLNLFGFNTDAVIVNRVLPATVDAGYLAQWREIQGRYEEEIGHAFSPLPIRRVPLMEQEVVGLPMLARVADAAFGDGDPAEILYAGRVEEVRKEPEGYVLDLAVPFVSREEIRLTQRGDDLTVQVGTYKRNVTLPRTLLGRPVLGAKFHDQRLRVRFGERLAAGEE